MPPILLLSLAIAGGLLLLKRKAGAAADGGKGIDSTLIDPSEKYSPNAPIAQRAIVAALHYNSIALYESTAKAIEIQLKMPKTAANLRAWATMAKQGGQTVAGEVGADGDEVGATIRKLYAQHKRAHPRRRAGARASAPALTPSAPPQSAPAPQGSPIVPWSSAYEQPIPDDDTDDDTDTGDVGATPSRRKRLPDWLRFSATQSKLSGDPALIRATAQVLDRMGYHEHAAIHLQALRR